MRSVISILCAWIAASPLPADQVTMLDGGSMRGEVAALDAEILELRTPLALAPLKLRLDAVREVRFPESGETLGRHGARLALANGDRLACELESIGPDSVRIRTDYCEPLEVERRHIASLQLGIRPRRVLYKGPDDASGWDLGNAWELEPAGFVSNGRGAAAFDPGKLPTAFSLQFELLWKGTPNLEVYFCSSNPSPGRAKEDRYRLQIRGNRLKLDRQSSGPNTFQTLGDIPWSISDYPTQRATLELRVDRPSRKLQIHVNDQLVAKELSDPTPAPEGDILIFNSLSGDPGTLRVGSVTLRAWNSKRDRHSSEDRGDPTEDALIDDDGNRFSGELIGTRTTSKGTVVLIDCSYFPDPLEVPVECVSTLFFKNLEKDVPRPKLLLGLPDAGLISATGCVFSDDTARIDHPLLGRFTARRDALRALAHRQLSSQDEREEEEP